MHYGIKGLLALLVAYFVFTASNCEERIEFGLTAVDFTKEKRETLGDLLQQTIETTPEEYTLLNRRSKRDSVIVTYLQTLYNQATQEIRQDRLATPSNRWDAARTWQVSVLDDDNRYAFSLPGGHFYVSTGFLSTLSTGYEMYYLMAFEATNISGRYLIDNLLATYNTSTLFQLIETDPETIKPTLIEMTKTLRDELTFQDDIIREIDQETGELICQTSIFDRFGIQPILEKLSTQEQYRDTRPSYANRIDFIAELPIEGCGTIKSTGLYERMVLDNCLLYTSPSPRDRTRSRMPSSA